MIDNLSIDGTIPMDVFCNHISSTHHNSPLHVHSHHIELLLLISGNVSLYTEKQAFPIEPRTLIVIPDGIWHCILTHDSTSYERVYINVDVNLVDYLSTSNTNLYQCFRSALAQEISTLLLDEKKSNEFISLCDNLVDIIDKNQYAADIYQHILLSQILLLANKIPPVLKHPQNRIPKLLEQITNFISQNIENDLSLSIFSKEFFLNPNYLNQYFKKYMNVSLHTYIIEKRIELAKQLLSQGSNVTTVCERCGFHNYSNFIRTFGNHVGISPGQYKKNSSTKHTPFH